MGIFIDIHVQHPNYRHNDSSSIIHHPNHAHHPLHLLSTPTQHQNINGNDESHHHIKYTILIIQAGLAFVFSTKDVHNMSFHTPLMSCSSSSSDRRPNDTRHGGDFASGKCGHLLGLGCFKKVIVIVIAKDIFACTYVETSDSR